MEKHCGTFVKCNNAEGCQGCEYETEGKCYLCDQPAVDTRRIIVDVDYDRDDEGDHLNGVWANVGLCQDHIEQFDNREGEFGGGGE